MSTESASINLTHHFLIAMPGMQDASFARSVVYLCEHSPKRALGLIINKPADLDMAGLFEKIELTLDRPDLGQAPVLYGGPCETERGFVLHESITVEGKPEGEALYASSLVVPGGLEMTTSRDVLEAVANGGGPRRLHVMLGYSGWSEGQLESELSSNAWLTVAADPAVIFDTPAEQRYDRALALLGLQAWMLSPQAGRA